MQNEKQPGWLDKLITSSFCVSFICVSYKIKTNCFVYE